jgi:hypothetical protein
MTTSEMIDILHKHELREDFKKELKPNEEAKLLLLGERNFNCFTNVANSVIGHGR